MELVFQHIFGTVGRFSVIAGVNTNNFLESQFRVVKETVMGREKAYNPCHLVIIVSKFLGQFCKKKACNHLAMEIFLSLLAQEGLY